MNEYDLLRAGILKGWTIAGRRVGRSVARYTRLVCRPGGGAPCTVMTNVSVR